MLLFSSSSSFKSFTDCQGNKQVHLGPMSLTGGAEGKTKGVEKYNIHSSL